MTTAWLKDVIGYGTHAARPAAGSAGALYYETDTNTLLRDNGTTWDALTLGGGAGALTKIAEVIVGVGGAPTIAFSSIPGAFRSLQMHFVVRSDAASTNVGLQIQLNGDTASNYDNSELYNSSSSAAASAQSMANTHVQIAACAGASAPSGCFTSGELLLPNYAGTTAQKGGLSRSATETATSAGGLAVESYVMQWRATAAISSMLLFPGSGHFVQDSIASLYGVS